MICGATGLHNKIVSAIFWSFFALSVESVGISNPVQRLLLFCLLAEAVCAIDPSGRSCVSVFVCVVPKFVSV